MNRPTFEPIWCACKACGHWWDDWQPNNVPAATWIAHIRALRCPRCGKGRRAVLLRTKPLADKPDDDPERTRALAQLWLAGHV